VNALQLADQLDHDSDIGEFKHYEASAMLRKQHEAIRQLRDGLLLIAGTSHVDAVLDPQRAIRVAKAALAATEDVCANT